MISWSWLSMGLNSGSFHTLLTGSSTTQYLEKQKKSTQLWWVNYYKPSPRKISGLVFLISRTAIFSLYKKLRDTKTEHYHIHFLTCVKYLNAGDQFGELALLNSKPRAATIMTWEETFLAVLNKKGFDRNLKNSENTKLEREIKELNNFGIFKNLTRTSKSKVG